MAVATRARLDDPAGGQPVSLSLRSTIADLLVMRKSERSQTSIGFFEWAATIPEPKGPLDFKRFPYQVEMYQVLGVCEEGVVMKAVQVGVSAFLVRWTMFWADTRGVTALYVFPKAKHMYDFADTRIKPLIEGSEYLRSRIPYGNVAHKGLRKIGLGHVYYRGCESKDDLQSVDADVLALDEYDDLNPRNVPDAERRISGSQLGLIRRVGVPTDPEYGIARAFAASDKRRWFVCCPACGEWQHLDFWKNVRWEEDDGEVTRAWRVCRHCERDLDVSKGEWVAEQPSRSIPGYHVSKLIVPGADLRTVVKNSKERQPNKVETFHTKDLGLPLAKGTGGLERTVLAAAISAAESYFGGPIGQAPGYRGTNLVTAGIDVASVRALNVRISEHLDPLTERGHRKRALYVGEAQSFDEVVAMLHRYNVSVAVIDHLPEGRLAYGLAEMFPGRVYVLHYSGQQHEALVVNTIDRKVSVQRVPVMDTTIEIMRSLRNLLPGDLPDDYVEHMVANRRKEERDEFGRQTVHYENGDRPDDYFQAEVYDLVATEIAKIQMELMGMAEPEVTTLDQRVEFERSKVNQYDEMGYSPGPGDTYDPGVR